MVRTFRDAAGVTQKGLAGALGYTNGWVSNVENGQLRPRPEQVTALEHELGVPPGALMNVYEQLDGESLPGWFREWVDEEAAADVLRTFELALVPGLLQTEEYARALLPADQAAVDQRMARQKILARDHPPTLHVVLDEAVLYRTRGEVKIMRAQLEHLIASVGPRLTLQIVRSEKNPRSTGAFNIATVDGSEVGYVETIIRGIVTSSREDIAELLAAWEAIRTFALSQEESIDFIRKVIEERWT
ncbi:helix-turn-helix domain-containing protein [Actinoallomurus bryophytorum]|uniref:helix-turn-helix domain-containing protein n=1 Tax=Actinoallomurus bryophytorum TaxID=1490222 RepID=UPI001639B565|nr:helix-turn-helix transcriptional regulator [Actinoallomurus bryophytorum]